jgi:putative two-component system response regulator
VARVLVVDDDRGLRSLLRKCLEVGGHDVIEACDGPRAVGLLKSGEHVDVLLTDYAMPGFTGLEVISATRRRDPTLPCIIITAFSDIDLAMRAMAEGAVGFLPKPFKPEYLLVVVERALERRRIADEAMRLRLITPLLERFTMVLANTIEAKDEATQLHCERLIELADATAIRLGLDFEKRASIRLGACLHDVGKIGVPEHMLRAARRLNEDELEVMRRHSVIGADILANVDGWDEVRRIVRHHHERFDGLGYPDRLDGSRIPLGARIVCVVDSFDVINKGRPYSPPRSIAEALEEVRAQRGKQFDPDCADAFIAVIESGDYPVSAMGQRTRLTVLEETPVG